MLDAGFTEGHMLFFSVLASLAIIATAAFLHFRYPERVSEKPAALGALGVILLILTPVIISALMSSGDQPAAKHFKQSMRPYQQKGAFKPDDTWPAKYYYYSAKPKPFAGIKTTPVEPPNQDVVIDPVSVPIDPSAGSNPPPTSQPKITVGPLGDNLPSGFVWFNGRVTGSGPLSSVNSFVSANGAEGAMVEATLSGPDTFKIWVKLEPNTKYTIKIVVIETNSAATESEPFAFSTGP